MNDLLTDPEIADLHRLLRHPKCHFRTRHAIRACLQHDAMKRRRTKAMSALAEDRGGSLTGDGQGADSCSCGGECDACQLDEFCSRVSLEVQSLDNDHQQLLRSIRQADSIKQLRMQVSRITSETPADAEDHAEQEARRQLHEIADRRQALLDQLCARCGDSPLCEVKTP